MYYIKIHIIKLCFSLGLCKAQRLFSFPALKARQGRHAKLQRYLSHHSTEGEDVALFRTLALESHGKMKIYRNLMTPVLLAERHGEFQSLKGETGLAEPREMLGNMKNATS